MEEKFKERIVGKFYTVEDLMDLPAAGMVDPAKAREVSRALPVRFWIDTQELIGMLVASMAIIEANNENAPPAEARQGEVQKLVGDERDGFHGLTIATARRAGNWPATHPAT